jgi:putative NADH-flavin reductase
MKVLVLGATGRTGHELVVQGLDQGHEVTALVRGPDGVTVDDERLRIVTGSATDPEAVDSALDGQEAVLCALGPRSAKALVSCDLMRASIGALVPAMERRGVSRVVLLSALGAGQSAGHAPAALRYAFRTLFRRVGKDKEEAERNLRESRVDWTVVYPPSLTDGPRTGGYRHGETLELKGVPKISRADVAEFMLAQLTSGTYSRKGAVVST